MKHKKIYSKVKRLVKEIYILRETNCSVRQLASEFKTTVRTIQRDLKDIKNIGFELVKQKRSYEIPTDNTMQKFREQQIRKEEKPVKAKNEGKKILTTSIG